MRPTNAGRLGASYSDSELESLGDAPQVQPFDRKRTPKSSPRKAKGDRRSLGNWQTSPLEEIEINLSIVATPERQTFCEDGDDNETFSLTAVNSFERKAKSHRKEPLLSDPNSEIWKGRENAKLAVVIPLKRKETGTLSPTAKRQAHLLVERDGDLVPGKPAGRLWLHSVQIAREKSKTLNRVSVSSTSRSSAGKGYLKPSSSRSKKGTTSNATTSSSSRQATLTGYLKPSSLSKKEPSSNIITSSSSRLATLCDDAASSTNVETSSDDELNDGKLITQSSRKLIAGSLHKSTIPSDDLDARIPFRSLLSSTKKRRSTYQSSSPATATSVPTPNHSKGQRSLRAWATKKIIKGTNLTSDDLSEDELNYKRSTSDSEDDDEYVDDEYVDDEDVEEEDGDDYTSDESDESNEPLENEVDDSQSDNDVPMPKSKRFKRSISLNDNGSLKADFPLSKATSTSLYRVNRESMNLDEPVELTKGSDTKPRTSYKYKVGVKDHLRPIHKIPDIFADMVDNALEVGLDEFLTHLNGRKLKVATMCSGTESPVLALQLFGEALKKRGQTFEIEHLFSAEIVPFKQAYIERNFSPPVIFRDVKELARKGAVEATTAYGGKAAIPGGADLLVTGFSCVDFSALNNRKKRLEAEGESGDTFFSLRKYALRFRPKMIVVENVSGAPWDDIQKEFRKIGYHSYFQRLDTKNFYVPHTRVRGYIICVDRHLYGLTRDSKPARGQRMLDSALTKMKEVLKALERPASSTVEAFSLAEDDPRVQSAREELSNSGRGDTARGSSRDIDWTRCHTRHEAERTNQCLGQMRPITQWQDGGSCKPADYMWRDWTQVQVERVLDTIDMSFLRNLNRGFDQQYKVRVLDLSQNVDRNIDTTGAGITGCLTPSGIPWNTMRGGPLVGVESLALQGLPIDRLQLSHEKQTQLQDLAGNAMSSPVVGAAILAILIAGYTILPPGQASESSRNSPDQSVHEMNEGYIIPFNANLNTYEPLSVAQAQELAAKSVRLCLCEGRSFITKSRLKKCSPCKHTTCEKCGGNPSHEKYEPISDKVIAQRILPSDFEDMIKRAIPMRVQVAGVTEACLEEVFHKHIFNIDRKDWEISIETVHRAFQSELRFHSTRRSEIWTIFYESEHARMELVIDSSRVQWLLFAKPLFTEPVNSRIRKLLSRPIARMNPEPHDIAKGSWRLWLPKNHDIEASFTGHSEMARSFEDIMGLGRSLDATVWTNYTISIPDKDVDCLDVNINGTYKLLQNCGTASGSLHVKVDTEASPAPLFLFLDPDRVNDPEDDYFVFSTDKRRLNYDQVRPIIARVDPKWRPQQFNKEIETGVEEATIVRISVDGCWIDLPNAHFKSNKGQRDESFSHARPDLEIFDNPDLSSCQTHIAVLSCKAAYLHSQNSFYMKEKWCEIDIVNQKEFFAEFAWLIQRAQIIPGLDDWREIQNYIPSPCSLCAPTSPGIKWKLETEQKKGKLFTNLVAFENPKEAVEFEAALKTRAPPLITQVHVSSAGLAQLKIGFNPMTLIHRAVAKLSSSPDVVLEVSWRLVTDDTTVTKVSLPKFDKLKDNDNDSPASNPPGFKLKLRPEQLRSLGWMLKQEAEQVEPFIEEEVEECLISHLGWRAEGRARKPVKVRGGLLADDVGFGKTATILGLIDSQRTRDSAAARDFVNGRIRVKATLIMVPHHLCDQWRREISKFTESTRKCNVLVIRSLSVLRNCTIEQFQLADIIITSLKFCDDEEYLFKIAEFAGVVELPKARPWRATCTWYHDALKHMPRLVDELKNGGAKAAEMRNENLAASQEKAKSEEFFVPSRRLRGQAYQDAKGTREISRKKKRASETPEPSASKRKRSPSAKRDPQDTDSEDDSDVEDTEPQEAEVEKAKGNRTASGGSKRKRANPQDTDSDGETEPKESGFKGAKGKGAKGKKASNKDPNDLHRADPFGINQIAKGQKKWVTMKCPLFELFEFRRLVVDEYTYVTGQESLTVSNIKANSRWILSATPSLKDFADVKSIASFLGINLGVDDFANGAIQASTIKRMLKDRTDAEEFRSFKENHSVAWHRNRNSIAQRFLDQFVRKNVPKIGDIKFTEHIMSVILPPAEQAIYLELQHLLVTSDFKMKKRKANNNNDRERRIRELLGTSDSPGEALIKCASHFTLNDLKVSPTSADDACDALVKLREKQLMAIKEELREKVDQAEWLYRNCKVPTNHYGAWKSKVTSNRLGDPSATAHMIDELISCEAECTDDCWERFYNSAGSMEQSNKNKGAKRGKFKGRERDADAERFNLPILPEAYDFEKGVYPRQIELRNVVNDLYKKSEELVTRYRSLRYLDTIRGLQKSLDDGCSCARCGQEHISPERVFVLQQCGHILCSKCLAPHAGKHLECLVTDCLAYNRPHEVFPAMDLCVNVESTRISRSYGQKIGEVVHLVESIPKDEQVLLFVQFEDLMAKFAEAFSERSISYAKLTGQGNTSKILEDFQTNTNKSKNKVLLLNMGDETAAGSNLTNANHVIFTSPYLAWSQHDYQQSMVQAKGRSVRYGQTKHVHIYNFLSLRTIDVDISQARSGKILVKKSRNRPELPFQKFKPSGFEFVDATGEADVGEFSSPIFGKMAVDLDVD